MNAADLTVLAAPLVISLTAILLMLLVALKRHHLLSLAVSLGGVAVAFVSLWPTSQSAPRAVGPLLLVDSFAILYMAVLLAITAAILLFAYNYLERSRDHKEEFYILVLLATVGAMVLVAANHIASLFLGLETLSIALYALAGYVRTGPRPLEAAMKYLVLASSSVAFLLFGAALIYEETGSLGFAQIAAVFHQPSSAVHGIILFGGTALLLTGIGFKLALVPFHLWAPDVYEGSPLPVTALIATISKASVFGLLLRWFHLVPAIGTPLWVVLAVSAIASMLAGNLLALAQNNVKRILAYSSIAHMGYFFVAVLAGGALGLSTATYYLISYLITTAAAFGVLVVLSGDQEDCDIDQYRGLFWQRPVLAGILTAALLSLAGIPLTAGFLGKFYVMTAGASSGVWTLLIVLIVSSVIGLFYYLRIVLALYSPAPGGVGIERARVPVLAGLSLSALTILLFVLGVYPVGMWGLITTAVDSLP
jgi:NADH-quinone oxidoreductase subunit N